MLYSLSSLNTFGMGVNISENASGDSVEKTANDVYNSELDDDPVDIKKMLSSNPWQKVLDKYASEPEPEPDAQPDTPEIVESDDEDILTLKTSSHEEHPEVFESGEEALLPDSIFSENQDSVKSANVNLHDALKLDSAFTTILKDLKSSFRPFAGEVGSEVGKAVGSFVNQKTHSKLEELARARAKRSLGVGNPLLEISSMNDQLGTLGMDAGSYNTLLNARNSDLVKTKLESEIKKINTDTVKSQLETELLAKKVHQGNTLLGRMDSTSIGQIIAPMATGALIMGGGMAGLKTLDTLGILGSASGLRNPISTVVQRGQLESLYREQPLLREMPEEKILTYLSTINRLAPEVGKIPSVTASLIVKFINYGGPDASLVSGLVDTQNKINQNRQRSVDIFNLGNSVINRR